MNISTKLLKAAAGQAGGASLDVDDVFSTFLYYGTNVAQTITNNIDLTEGGLVWQKLRVSDNDPTDTQDHYLRDTARGGGYRLNSNTANAQFGNDGGITAFNSNGFSLSSGSAGNANQYNYVSWTFRKAPKFFDVVQYTGDGSSNRSISHSLGSTPGFIIIKDATNVNNWFCWHNYFSSLSSGSGYLMLNSTNTVVDTTGVIDTVTSTSFNVTGGSTNASGATIIAYVFAHNNSDGEFGPDSDQDIIKCGSYTGTSSSSTINQINLGFEPQWLLIKGADYATGWQIYDSMRGIATGGKEARLYADADSAEGNIGDVDVNATGFAPTSASFNTNSQGNTYIYIAIRRGPLAVPEDATKVFGMDAYTSGGDGPVTGFVTDFSLLRLVNNTYDWYATTRLTGKVLYTNQTSAEVANQYAITDRMDGMWDTAVPNHFLWGWKRAPGYFDVVAYTGDGTGTRTLSHNLEATPEMIWLKKRSTTSSWYVYHKDLSDPNNGYLSLEDTSARSASSGIWGTGPTSTNFQAVLNTSGQTHIAYLFATVAGVSKVGSYTGNGSSQNIDCGFSSGARFVLIKGTSSSGYNWCVWDSTRGIVSGNDPKLTLDTTDAEQTGYDFIDPHSSGFSVTNQPDVNNNGATYIFYAIA